MAAVWAQGNESWVALRRGSLLVTAATPLGSQEEEEVRVPWLGLLLACLGHGAELHKQVREVRGREESVSGTG